jgi:hypothetical protein
MIGRPLEIADGALIRAKAQRMAVVMYPELIPDIEKIHWLVRSATTEMSHYARTVGAVGEPKAVLIARVNPNLWAMKKHATILLWYSELPGGGATLLREFRDWVKEQGNIVMAGFEADWIAFDERPFQLAERIGFKRRGEGAFIYFPRGSMA